MRRRASCCLRLLVNRHRTPSRPEIFPNVRPSWSIYQASILRKHGIPKSKLQVASLLPSVFWKTKFGWHTAPTNEAKCGEHLGWSGDQQKLCVVWPGLKHFRASSFAQMNSILMMMNICHCRNDFQRFRVLARLSLLVLDLLQSQSEDIGHGSHSLGHSVRIEKTHRAAENWLKLCSCSGLQIETSFK